MKKIFFLSLIIFALSFGGEFDKYRDLFKPVEKISFVAGKSLEEFERVYEDSMNNPAYLYRYAWTAYLAGRIDVAKEKIERAVQLHPNDPFLRYAAGKIYLRAGEKEKAIANFEKAIENQYEYLDAWEELVKLSPKYYFNIAQLFAEKAHLKMRSDLADEAIMLFNRYINQVPDGEFVDKARAKIHDMELLKQEIAAHERKLKEREMRKQRAQQFKQAIVAEKERFFTYNPVLVGIFYGSITPSKNFAFTIKDDAPKRPGRNYASLTDTIYFKNLLGTLNEFIIGGGYIWNRFIFRAHIHFADANVKYVYLLDTIITPSHDVKEIKDEIARISEKRISTNILYNVYFIDPLLIFVEGTADAGYIKLIESNPKFKSCYMAGLGLGAAAMIKYHNFILELNFQKGLLGSSRGTYIGIGVMYKFKI
ncbi:hypothetical protein J7J62_07235 [bacterium]|nr:hypothetical protein [bacterium]